MADKSADKSRATGSAPAEDAAAPTEAATPAPAGAPPTPAERVPDLAELERLRARLIAKFHGRR